MPADDVWSGLVWSGLVFRIKRHYMHGDKHIIVIKEYRWIALFIEIIMALFFLEVQKEREREGGEEEKERMMK